MSNSIRNNLARAAMAELVLEYRETGQEATAAAAAYAIADAVITAAPSFTTDSEALTKENMAAACIAPIMSYVRGQSVPVRSARVATLAWAIAGVMYADITEEDAPAGTGGPLASIGGAGATNLGSTYYAQDTGQLFESVEYDPGLFRWVEVSILSGSAVVWSTATAWWIDSTAPATNTGLAQGSPIPWKEFRRRILAAGGFAQNLGRVTVNVLTDLPQADPLDVRDMLAPIGTEMFVDATLPAPLFSGVVGVVTAKNPAANTQWGITAPGVPVSWTASGLISKRARVTSGANVGALFWATFDEGGKKADIASPVVPASAYPLSPFDSTFPTIAPADPFVVENVVNVDTYVAQQSSSQNAAARVSGWVFRGFKFNNLSFNTPEYAGPFGALPCTYIGCSIGQSLSPFDIYVGCQVVVLSQNGGGATNMLGGYIAGELGGYLYVSGGGQLTLFDVVSERTDCTAELGACIFVAGGGLGCFRSTSDAAVKALVAGTIQSQALMPIYGKDNTGYGAICSGGIISHGATTKPTVTGTLGDVNVAGRGKTWAVTPYFDTTAGAGVIPTNFSQQSSGSVALNGATVVNVTAPLLQAADRIILNRTIDGGAVGAFPKTVKTAGVGFAISGTAGDTSTYEWSLQKGQ